MKIAAFSVRQDEKQYFDTFANVYKVELQINRSGFTADDIESVKLEKTLSNNELKYQEELRKKYNPDDIFRNRQKANEYIETQTQSTEIAPYKESFFRKIISKIKLFFHK